MDHKSQDALQKQHPKASLKTTWALGSDYAVRKRKGVGKAFWEWELMPQTRGPDRVLASLARQRPQQATGGGEEVDGRRAVCDEGGLQPQSLKHLHLQDKPQPIRGVQSLQQEVHVPIGCCEVTWSTQDNQSNIKMTFWGQ